MTIYIGSQKVGPCTVKPQVGIPKGVDANGKYGAPVGNFSFALPSNAMDLGNYALYSSFLRCVSLTSVDLSSLTTLSGYNAMYEAFYGCTSLTSVDLSSLTTVSGTNAMYEAFYGCTSLTSVDLSSLTTVSSNAMTRAFNGCTSLMLVDLSSLTTLSGYSVMGVAFAYCTSLTSVDLSSLTTMNNYGTLSNTFAGCTNLTSLSFPSLTSTFYIPESGTTYTNQFQNMLYGVTGCTVHFPSNLQSVIGSWSDVTAGFGGTNTIILFDLPATT